MTWIFLLPLVLGFTPNTASAFTAAFSRRWGERGGRIASFILRNVLGIPVWAIGFVLAVRALSRMLLPPGAAMAVTGWILVAIGGAVILWALGALGRRAAAPSVRDTLVADGPYRYVRHPIHAGTFLEFVGLWLLIPTLTVTVACIVGVGWLLAQTMAEEVDLQERVPGYRRYMARVPRFVPRLGRERVQDPEPIMLLGSLRPLQEQFNTGRDRLRFIALLSPT